MTDDIWAARLREFDRYVQWRLGTFSNLVQTQFTEQEQAVLNYKIYSDDISREIGIVTDFDSVKDFLSFVVESDTIAATHFAVQVFTDFNGEDFGKISYWDNPDLKITTPDENLDVKVFMVLEYFMDNKAQTTFVLAI